MTVDRREREEKDPEWWGRFIEQQQKLDIQIDALAQLEVEFLNHLWSDDSPIDTKTLIERDEHLIELLEAAELPPHMVLRLFYALEYKAVQEVNKVAALAQTTLPNVLASKLPAALIANALAVHKHAFTTGTSERNSRAAQKKRPCKRHKMRGAVEQELQSWIDQGRFDCDRRGDKSAFVDHILSDSRFGQDRRQTVFKWINIYLEK